MSNFIRVSNLTYSECCFNIKMKNSFNFDSNVFWISFMYSQCYSYQEYLICSRESFQSRSSCYKNRNEFFCFLVLLCFEKENILLFVLHKNDKIIC